MFAAGLIFLPGRATDVFSPLPRFLRHMGSLTWRNGGYFVAKLQLCTSPWLKINRHRPGFWLWVNGG